MIHTPATIDSELDREVPDWGDPVKATFGQGLSPCPHLFIPTTGGGEALRFLLTAINPCRYRRSDQHPRRPRCCWPAGRQRPSIGYRQPRSSRNRRSDIAPVVRRESAAGVSRDVEVRLLRREVVAAPVLCVLAPRCRGSNCHARRGPIATPRPPGRRCHSVVCSSKSRLLVRRDLPAPSSTGNEHQVSVSNASPWFRGTGKERPSQRWVP